MDNQQPLPQNNPTVIPATTQPLPTSLGDQNMIAELPKKHSRLKKFLLILASFFGALVVLCIVIFYFLPQIWIITLIDLIPHKFPNAFYNKVPTVRQVKQFSDFSGYTPISKYNLTFNVPWKGIQVQEKRDSDVAETIKFQNGDFISIMDPSKLAPATLVDENLSPDKVEQIKQIFGAGVATNQYQLRKAILNTTPDQVTLTTPVKEAIAKSILLTLKPIGTTLTPSNIIYNFETPTIEGFQTGVPGEKTIILDLYDSQNNHYNLLLIGTDTTQDGIDLLLSSFKIGSQPASVSANLNGQTNTASSSSVLAPKVSPKNNP